MKIHRVAMVGCGALAQQAHLPNIRKNPRLKLAVTCDVDAATAQICKEKFGADRVETDWHKLIGDKDIDLFVLATHTNLRGEFIIPALEAGQPVYTEKPLAPSRQEMVDIVKASRSTGVPVCVGHNRRSSPAMLEFKRLLDRAKSGETIATRPTVDRSGSRAPLPEESQLQILMRVNDDVRSWKDWIFWDDEGIMFSEMVHFIDLALWLNNAYPVRVFAEGSVRGNFTLLIKFNDGSITTLQHTMVGNFDYPKELFEATADNITIAMDQHIEVRQCGLADELAVKTFPYAEGCEWATEQGMTGYMKSIEAERIRADAAGEPPRWLNVNKGHYQQLDRFLDHIEGRGKNPCDVESAVPVNRLAMKLLESARWGMPVAVGLEDWHLPSV
ncbi:MAG: Gfo/Idh/MocA family oxidoreductase [bacterium]|jgi:predicted dehydrogenase|nr:Gfo/Idh/MocA family oxidoreductase [bacterium]MDD3804810.1 Gfo/Idh/MocA family oxidoreductase [bacterium]MDD4558200.1 Gfo/Idh/MocA family oxidoreductase [bacterium]